jgi:centromeric protein E
MRTVQVVVRTRPSPDLAWLLRDSLVAARPPTPVRSKGLPSEYRFGRVYRPEERSSAIFEEKCRNVLEEWLAGQDGSVMAYGQTNSGKTHTMLGTEDSPGLIPYVLREAFQPSTLSQHLEYKFFVQYCEIYNERVFDLLDDCKELRVEAVASHFKTSGRAVRVDSYEAALRALVLGESQRSYRAKASHDHSSRSHTIFTLRLVTSTFTNAKGFQTISS